MRVPDDIILLWTDDNWGNIRRLPAADERGRSGGAGVYYHFGTSFISTLFITKSISRLCRGSTRLQMGK